MRMAIELSRSAMQHGIHPFGALIVHQPSGQVLNDLFQQCNVKCNEPIGENAVHTLNDVTSHAEMQICRQAQQLNSVLKHLDKDKPFEFRDCTLYSSTEPCGMCSGAIYWLGIRQVVFRCSADDLQRLTETDDRKDKTALRHGPTCFNVNDGYKAAPRFIGNILSEEAKQVHIDFNWTRYFQTGRSKQ